jgi:hypothetical protein
MFAGLGRLIQKIRITQRILTPVHKTAVACSNVAPSYTCTDQQLNRPYYAHPSNSIPRRTAIGANVLANSLPRYRTTIKATPVAHTSYAPHVTTSSRSPTTAASIRVIRTAIAVSRAVDRPLVRRSSKLYISCVVRGRVGTFNRR